MIHFRGYLSALIAYIIRLSPPNGALVLGWLAAAKVGFKAKGKAALLLECWTFFQYLHRQKQVQVTDAGPNEFRLRCTDGNGSHRQVKLVLRMPGSVSSDSAVFDQIFVKFEYLHVIQWFARVHSENPTTILDLGGNIGCATLFFAALFPSAHIYCLEPDAGNFQRLEVNLGLNPHGNIRSRQAGIWTRNCRLRCVRDFRDGRESAFRFVESEAGDGSIGVADALDIQTVTADAGFRTVDLLKLDVEGAEATLLRDARFGGFLQSKVARVAVEIHEEFISIGEARKILDSLDFTTDVVDEFVVGIKRSDHS